MKSIFIVLLVLGLALAKPFEFDELEEFFEDPAASATTPSPPKPTSDHGFTPTHGPGPSPTKKRPDLWGRFMHFLLVKSVEGVKPDEHPDLKYRKPGEELVEHLLDVKKEVVKTVKGPLHKILKLIKEDWEDMFGRVHEAVKEQNIAKAKHVVGEYFIALQRRFAALAIHAYNKGLFEEIKDDELPKMVKREMDKHMKKAEQAVKFILKNFNQFRVNDGLMDEPFVRLGVETAKVYMAAVKQTMINAKVSQQVYTDLVSEMVYLSIDMHNHEAAVQRAGASVLSFIRRGTKVQIALHRIYGPKKCYGPGKPRVRGRGRGRGQEIPRRR